MNPTGDSFDDWFGQEYRRVLSSVIIVCAGDVTRAEDATNEAFLDALQRWERVSIMESPRSWVTTVAINKAKRSWLRRRRYVELVNEHDAVDHVGNDNAEIWDAVRRLSVKQRTAIVLRYLDDLSQAQIADALGVAPGTVSATLTQARKKLRVELEGETI